MILPPAIRRSTLWLCALTWALSACAPIVERPAGRLLDVTVGEELLADWLAQAGQVNTLQGMAKVKVKTSERSVSGTQVLLVERPDRFRAETLSPFGTPLLMLASDGADLGVLLPTEGVYYAGTATPANLGRFTRMSLRVDDLVSLLLYRAPVLHFETLQVYGREEGGWLVQLDTAQRRQLLLFDPDRRLTRVSYLDGERLLLEVGYERFETAEARFPQRFDIQLPDQEVTASLEFDELALNREFQPGIFRIDPPPGIRIYPLDDGAGINGVPDATGAGASRN